MDLILIDEWLIVVVMNVLCMVLPDCRVLGHAFKWIDSSRLDYYRVRLF